MRPSQAIHPESETIIAALPLPQQRGLYVEWPPGWGIDELRADLRRSDYLILEEGSGGIFGRAIAGENGTWYLGCIECRSEIAKEDAGMCGACRQDLAHKDEQDRLAYEAPLPWGPDSLKEL
jgi:hypothetical protein